MAKYIKTPNLWDLKVIRAIETGALVLQPGQWVFCGPDKQKSRFVSFNRVFNVAHGGDNNQVIAKFKQRIEAKRLAIKRGIRL